jgi:hypothetical protein
MLMYSRFGIEFAPEVVQADGSVRNLAWRIFNAKKVLVCSLNGLARSEEIADPLFRLPTACQLAVVETRLHCIKMTMTGFPLKTYRDISSVLQAIPTLVSSSNMASIRWCLRYLHIEVSGLG